LHPYVRRVWGAVMGAGEWMALRGELALDRVLEEYVEFVSFALLASMPGAMGAGPMGPG